MSASIGGSVLFLVILCLPIVAWYLEPYRRRMLQGISDRHNEWLVKSRAEVVAEFGEQAGLDFDRRFK